MISGTVTGNVGKDATTREHDGKTVLSFTVASRRFEKGAEQTDWVDVSFWGERARKIAQYVTKGCKVGVRGTLYVREYEHQGSKRASLTMRADDVELLGGKRDDDAPYHADYGAVRLGQRLAQEQTTEPSEIGGVDAPF